MPLFSRLSERLQLNSHSTLGYLNIVQFFGALNDNMFKFLLAFLLIDVEGLHNASSILSFATALFVIPFLLFSSLAGVLADKFSKQKMIIAMKSVEMLVIFLSIFAFRAKSAAAGYTLLFILATHSAIFGPSKYGIIPELVPEERVSKANGLITASTYLAAIVGTFLASFVTQITDRNFPLSVSVCFLFSVIGFLASLKIKPTLAQGEKKRVNPLFFLEIYRSLQLAKKRRHLLLSIVGSASFLALAAFTQLNVIPLAIESLGLSDATGGYLFLATALGIAFGAYSAGKISKNRVELGLACFAAFTLSLLFFGVYLFSSHLYLVILFLFLLGMFGGAFIIPCDSYTQVNSPPDARGQFIGTANFLGFAGVLIASFLLYFFSNILALSPAQNFAMLSLCILLLSLFLTIRLSDFSLFFFAHRFFNPFFGVKIQGLERLDKSRSPILILTKPSLKNSLLLLGSVPHLQLFIPKKAHKPSFLDRLFYSIYFIPSEENLEKMFKQIQTNLREELTPCLLWNKKIEAPSSYTPIFVEISQTPDQKSTMITFS